MTRELSSKEIKISVPVVFCCFLISREAMSMSWWKPARKGRSTLSTVTTSGHYNSSNNSQIAGLTGEIRGVFSVPTYWNNYVYIGGISDHLKAFSLSNGLLFFAASIRIRLGIYLP